MLIDEVEKLITKTAEMCRMVEYMLTESAGALSKRDVNTAQRVIDYDPLVDEAEMDIEKACMRVLLRQQPVACDFREVSCILKMITDIERIGDQASDIAALCMELGKETQPVETILYDMGKLAVDMVRDSVNSFLHNDTEKAKTVVKVDDRMDELFLCARKAIVKSISDNADSAEDEIILLMVAKYYERIGDHAVNVCEWTDYNYSGIHRKY